MKPSEKIEYTDADDNPVSLHQLVRIEPGWAESRINWSVNRISELELELRRRSTWHNPNCRKMVYDISSSPCTCEAEYNRDNS